MTISRNDMIDLLTYVAGADRRTVGQVDVKVWMDAAEDGEWPNIDFAYRAVVQHRNEHPGTWLEPGHITQQWKRVRQEALQRFELPRAPRELEDNHQAYVWWCREQQQRHLDEHSAAFIAGQVPQSARLRAVEG